MHDAKRVFFLKERRKSKRIAAVLDSEDGQQIAVDEEQSDTCDDDNERLAFGIDDSGSLDDQGNRGKRQSTIYHR